MSQFAVWISALSAASLLAGAATAQELNPQPEPPGRHREFRVENIAVRLPPGPCVNFGGRVIDGGNFCVVRYAFIEAPAPCRSEGGRVVQTRDGRDACLLRR